MAIAYKTLGLAAQLKSPCDEQDATNCEARNRESHEQRIEFVAAARALRLEYECVV
jgi:hypothetical protein